MARSNGNALVGGGRTNVWDSQNRLYSCTYYCTTSTNTYASDGLRHRMVSGTTTTDYAYYNTMFVREFTGTGTVKATYLPGPRGVEYRRDDVAGTVRWYVYDGLGSVMGEVSPDGTLTRTQSFDVYGAVRTSSGTATTKHKFVGSLGHPSDDETGLIYMRARYYDPACGRFVSQDPAKSGTNWLAYCDNDPVNRLDRTGKFDLISTMQSMFLGALVSGAFAVALSLVLTGNLPSGKEFAMALIGGAVLGGVAANAGRFGSTLGSWIDECSAWEFARACLAGIGVGTTAGSITGVIGIIVFDQLRLKLFIDRAMDEMEQW